MILRITSPAEHGGKTYWDIEIDGKIFDGLGWDEMIGRVAALTMPIGLGASYRTHMKTPAACAAVRRALATDGDLLPSRSFGQVPELPPDVADAFESFKLAILRHQHAGWMEISEDGLCAELSALACMAKAPLD